MTTSPMERAPAITDDAFAPIISTSLRERKKARTRAQLIAVSQRMFAVSGYDATTLEAICAEVEIRPQTLLRYFESKAALALAPMTDPLNVVATALSDPLRSTATLDLWAQYLELEAREVSAPRTPALADWIETMRADITWIDHDPVLLAMASHADRKLRDVLAAALAHDRGLGPDDLHSVLVAALLVAGRSAVFDRWFKRDPDAESFVDDQLAVVEYALKSLPRRSARRLLRVASSQQPDIDESLHL